MSLMRALRALGVHGVTDESSDCVRLFISGRVIEISKTDQGLFIGRLLDVDDGDAVLWRTHIAALTPRVALLAVVNECARRAQRTTEAALEESKRAIAEAKHFIELYTRVVKLRNDDVDI